MFRAAMRDRYGDAELATRFRAFDTICSATQDRQDAVIALLDEQPIDLMIVIGGYNSSNTQNLARICAGTPARPITSPTPDGIASATTIATGRSRAAARSPRPAGCPTGPSLSA